MVNEMDIFEKKLRDKRINWKWIFAHTAIIWICTFLLGYIIGSVANHTQPFTPEMLEVIGLSNLLCALLIVLIISLVQKITWKHLFLVIILTGITSIYNVTDGSTLSEIFLGSIIGGTFMVIGKSLAMLILKTYDIFKK